MKFKITPDEEDKNILEVEPTMCNTYQNEEKEYIFAVKGRPFGCLASPHLPAPVSTLLDYNLVKDLGLKMYDLKYEKFTYGGMKMRIIGKVHITAEKILDGITDGTFHIKADVVTDLNKNLDCEAVAGVKMIAHLEQKNCTSSGTSITSSTTTPRRTPSSSSSLSSPRHSPPISSPAKPPQQIPSQSNQK